MLFSDTSLTCNSFLQDIALTSFYLGDAKPLFFDLIVLAYLHALIKKLVHEFMFLVHYFYVWSFNNICSSLSRNPLYSLNPNLYSNNHET